MSKNKSTPSWKEKTAFPINDLKPIFTETDAKTLISDFGFSNVTTQNLARELNDVVIGWWKISFSMQKFTPNRTDQKKLLAYLKQHVERILDGITILRKYGDETIKLLEIINNSPNYDVYPLMSDLEQNATDFLNQLRSGITILDPKYPERIYQEIELFKSPETLQVSDSEAKTYIERLKNLVKKIPFINRAGNDSTKPFHTIIYHLAEIYKRYTGKKPTCYYDDYNDEKQKYSTPFFNFVKIVKTKIKHNFSSEETEYFPKLDNNLGDMVKNVLTKLSKQ